MALVQENATLHVIDGDDWYDIRQLSYWDLAKLSQIEKDTTDERMIKWLAFMVLGWSEVGSDGKMLPLTPDNLKRLAPASVGFLTKTVKELLAPKQSLEGNENLGKPSGAT